MRLLLIAALIGLSAAQAMASDKDALAKAGVLGTWANDCSQPPSTSNYFMDYAVDSAGVATETQRTGKSSVRTLSNVQVVTKQWLLYTYIDADGEQLTILTFVDGNRKKSWWSVGKGGAAYIMDGKFLSGGSVPWFTQCK